MFHCISTDDVPHHTRCPTGKDSWCFYQRAEANDQEPPPRAQRDGAKARRKRRSMLGSWSERLLSMPKDNHTWLVDLCERFMSDVQWTFVVLLALCAFVVPTCMHSHFLILYSICDNFLKTMYHISRKYH